MKQTPAVMTGAGLVAVLAALSPTALAQASCGSLAPDTFTDADGWTSVCAGDFLLKLPVPAYDCGASSTWTPTAWPTTMAAARFVEPPSPRLLLHPIPRAFVITL